MLAAARAAGVFMSDVWGIWRRLARRTSFLDLRIWRVVSSRRRRPSSRSMAFLKVFLRCGGEGGHLRCWSKGSKHKMCIQSRELSNPLDSGHSERRRHKHTPSATNQLPIIYHASTRAGQGLTSSSLFIILAVSSLLNNAECCW